MANTEQFNSFARRSSDALIEVVATKLEALHGDMQDIKVTQHEITTAFQKLLVIEERQTNAAASQERAFTALVTVEKNLREVEGRVDVLEREAPMQKQTSTWVINAVWAAAVALVVLAAKKLGVV